MRAQLEQRRLALADEIRHYPTPIAGCDQHFNALLEAQHRVRRQLQRLDAICAEARTPEDLADRLTAFRLERLPEEAYPHDTVHTPDEAHG
jgi:hypothetical protein